MDYSLPLVLNESIAGNQHNLESFVRVTTHSPGSRGGGDCNVYQRLCSSAMLTWMFTHYFDAIGQ